MNRKPRVLLIDDQANEALVPPNVEAFMVSPSDPMFTEKVIEGLNSIDLLLMDHNLDLEKNFSLLANDGASLLGHLRSWARSSGHALPPIAIYTSEDEAFEEEVPTVGPAVPLGGSFEGREHVLAPVLDVEWLIRKGTESAFQTITILSSASSDLKAAAGNGRINVEELGDYLAIPRTAPWSQLARERLGLSRPPLTEPSATPRTEGARGIAPTLRWILQRALSFPGMLLSDLYLAWMLNINPADIDNILNNCADLPWAGELAKCLYVGPANELFGRRWWAAGVDFLAWQLRSEVDNAGSMAEAIRNLSGVEPSLLDAGEYVVSFDADLKENGLTKLEVAVQLHPRGWPAEALEPWMEREEAMREPLLWAMVEPVERLAVVE